MWHAQELQGELPQEQKSRAEYTDNPLTKGQAKTHLIGFTNYITVLKA